MQKGLILAFVSTHIVLCAWMVFAFFLLFAVVYLILIPSTESNTIFLQVLLPLSLGYFVCEATSECFWEAGMKGWACLEARLFFFKSMHFSII